MVNILINNKVMPMCITYNDLANFKTGSNSVQKCCMCQTTLLQFIHSFIHSFVYCRQQGPYKDMTQGNMKRKHEH